MAFTKVPGNAVYQVTRTLATVTERPLFTAAFETDYAPDGRNKESFNWFMKRTQPAAAEAAAGSQDLTR